MYKRMRLSPAMVVALIALFCSLTGVAAGVSLAKAVPLAKRALIADNSKKLQGKTAAQIVASVPAVSSVKSLVTMKTSTWAMAAVGFQSFSVSCDPGQKALGGGWDQLNPAAAGVVPLSSFPTSDDSGWTFWLWNTVAAHSGTLYVTCVT
ncbi:MAG: hypothetical protein ABSB96_04960 [Gaiellaceae bacterium]